MPAYSYMQCGCQLERKHLIKNPNRKHPRFQSLMCPDHIYSFIITQFTFCKICGVRRTFSPRQGRPSTLCAVHQKEKDNKSKKSTHKKPAKPLPTPKLDRKMYNQFGDVEKRANCKYSMNVCVYKYAWFEQMPCRICKRYKAKIFKIDPYKTSLDYKYG